MNYVFKTFTTPENFYVYDRYSNTVLQIPEKDYMDLKELELFENVEEHEEIIGRYQQKGVLFESIVEEIYHPYTDSLEDILSHNLNQVVLEIVKNCSSRCGYCSYSGRYTTRIHHNKKMSIETAKKSIDFGIRHSSALSGLNIYFYGADASFQKKLVNDCTQYIEEKYPEKLVYYTITVSPSFLNLENIRHLIEKNFTLIIELESSKNNKKISEGKRHFDSLIRNLTEIKKAYPDFYRSKILLNADPSSQENLKEILDFFSESDLAYSLSCGMDHTTAYSCKHKITCRSKYQETYNYEFFNAMLYQLGLIDGNNANPIFKDALSSMQVVRKMLNPHKGTPLKCHPGSACIPGEKNLFIDIYGNFYPCESVNKKADDYRIGDIHRGYFTDKIKDLINIGKITEDECKKCWNFYYCNICAAMLTDTNRDYSSKKCKLNNCREAKNNTLESFTDICYLKERNCYI